ncbi:E3 ubiquitin-protein ligase MSL2-like [Zerene cesonia]|uniref:E3 ubiquitin-protein ligase MSL2-like n=1 Tax=Zerene cesonia TaxID=33412 RepID=UPI0018E522B0|nr:E3 ubiquitin-protein ligase MSL2-like [Zerene cesonia]XP_038208409.1 E3 ubiquitin-protein ligase MSL2-like [Zerene cesonia]
MKMNATSLYVSTCRLIILADPADKSSWTDLFRLVPYLRQSLSCTVCGNLLKEPYTPTNSSCQHHVCKNCKGGRKKLKPSCSWCKDYDNYSENLQLRILLQCYKKLCEYFMGTDTFKTLLEEDEIAAGINGGTVASSGLIDLIQEAARFDDDFKCNAGLSKSAYSILPCVYTNSTSTQTQVASSSSMETRSSNKGSPNTRGLSNGSPLYSVMYAGSGNKITIKRKAVEESEISQSEPSPRESKSNQLGFKKPSNRSRNSSSSKRKGCRCGNATATPGKLTCCGQRCPCYVESKPCTECKCKGCRNPHRPDGMKVRPHIPQLDSIQITLNTNPDSSPSCSGSMDSLDTDTLTMEAMEESLSFTTDYKSSDIKVYTSQLQEVSPSLPATILMDDELPASPEDELSSPCDYTQCSPRGTNDTETSPHSATQDMTSDIEVDV